MVIFSNINYDISIVDWKAIQSRPEACGDLQLTIHQIWRALSAQSGGDNGRFLGWPERRASHGNCA